MTPLEPDTAQQDRQISQLSDNGAYTRLKEWFCLAESKSREWRKGANDDFGFVAGDQWSAADRKVLEDQRRPVITFNRCLTIAKAVAGMEINSRMDATYLPRGQRPGAIIQANEVLTAASRWMADQCDAEDEQSEAFQDATICGMGWTEERLDYEEDPDGKYIQQRIDPLEMFWDMEARSKNLVDTRYRFRARKMTFEDARAFADSLGASDVQDDELNAGWASGYETGDPQSVEERRLKKSESSGARDPKQEVTIVQAQWWERETYHRVADPLSGQLLELTDDELEQYKVEAARLGFSFDFVTQRRKVYKQAFLGGVILGGVRPSPIENGFSLNCITGERDHNKGTWFGLTRLMRDPQLWANKWLSQTLHILNTTAKGGILAETDAFKDQREAQDTYAQPDAITWVNPGAVANGKIMAKPGAGIPTAYVNLLEFAVSSIRDSVGVNLELLGQRDANQPGILEAHRKQAGMTILATMFDSLRRFRKIVGRNRLFFIQNYLSDDRLIRIAGPDGMKAVPLTRDATMGLYDVEIEDAPTSPNQREQTWYMISQIMPVFKNLMTPEAAIAILEYSPLPPKLVNTFKEMAQPKPNPEAEAAQKLMLAEKQSKIAETQSKAELNQATAAKTRAAAILDIATAGVHATNQELNRLKAQALIENMQRARGLSELGEWAVQPPVSSAPAPSEAPMMMPPPPPAPLS